MVRRHRDRADGRAYDFARGPGVTPPAELVRAAGSRWRVEGCPERAKGDCGLDESEGWGWTGWHRHVTLGLFALAEEADAAVDRLVDDRLRECPPLGLGRLLLLIAAARRLDRHRNGSRRLRDGPPGARDKADDHERARRERRWRPGEAA